MTFGFRVLGAFIVMCGAALCYGAVALWPAGMPEAAIVSSVVVAVLRIAGAGVAALLGVGNLIAGAVLVLFPRVRE
jgi:hypothetical protein